VILEFTGLSGAGKSTSEPYEVSGLKQRGYEGVLKSDFKKNYYKK
jgi:adenylylsulfate kinase-like enzyme